MKLCSVTPCCLLNIFPCCSIPRSITFMKTCFYVWYWTKLAQSDLKTWVLFIRNVVARFGNTEYKFLVCVSPLMFLHSAHICVILIMNIHFIMKKNSWLTKMIARSFSIRDDEESGEKTESVVLKRLLAGEGTHFRW